ncbi:DUF3825 domain-containing protein [Ruminococcus sp.]|uniref:DUF3825 domain-containing protein n=1 Tax=Ruminococcus sp. TaxID=41978 RepID=UPI003F03AE78
MIDNNSSNNNFCNDSENKQNNETECETKNFQETYRDFIYHPGEYAYAKCIKVTENRYIFQCIDKYSYFYISKSLADEFNFNIEIDKYYWAKLRTDFNQTENNCQYSKVWFVADASKSNTGIEINQFANLHRKNDIIYAPITDKNIDYISVNISPNFTLRIESNKFKGQYSDFKQGDIAKFEIESLLRKEKGKITVQLKPVFHETRNDKFLWDMLPKTMDYPEVTIPEKILGIINKNIQDKLFSYSTFTNCALDDNDDSLSREELISFLNEKYKIAYDSKKVTMHYNYNYYYMEFDTGEKDERGVPIHVCFKKKREEINRNWKCNLIGFSSAEREFEKYVYVDNWQKLLDELSDMLLKGENWDLSGENEKGKHFILKQYLKFTFYKVRLDNKITENIDKGIAVFDTGLVDKSYDNIYCYLEKNKNKYDFYERDWSFGYFATWGKGENGKNLPRLFAIQPNPAKYIDKLENIFYDTDKILFCDYEHIILDNINRLPFEFLKTKLKDYERFQKIINKYSDDPKSFKKFNEVSEYIKEDHKGDGKAYKEIQTSLETAVDTAIKYCRWNYKTAIPIYYPRTNGISLLLPLCLTNNDNRADVALVIEKLESGHYQGQTILTLDMAYQDARLICRPNSEWLTPENIETYHNIEDDDLDDFDE